ncbi:M23 family metallopeptidase [Galactobacter valiniphilus]|uniref:M23 family metallopeptidase n=1 Tax=Galactobacter valiniphilus TaxID=2676122 RepID=UPI003734DA10
MKKPAAIATAAVLALGGMLAIPVLLDNPTTPAAQAADQCGAGATIGTVNVSALPVQNVGTYGAKQLRNAAIIINEASKAGVGRKGAVIALMTAMQESTLLNHANDGSFIRPATSSVLSAAAWAKARTVAMESMKYPHEAVGSDWDSIGLYQQRPSAGWGTVEQIMNPSYSAATFIQRMKKIPDWEHKAYGQVAQAVQISAFPDAYNKHQSTAEKIIDALAGVTVTDATGAGTDPVPGSCATNTGGFDGTVSAQGWVQPVKTYTGTPSGFGAPRAGYLHMGEDFSAPKNTPIYAAADGKVTRSSCSDLAAGRSPCQIQIDHGDENGQRISTLYVHMFADGLIAKVGDQVKAGDHIANVGTNGNSTGYHLHFEVWRDKTPISPIPFLQAHGVTLKP